MTCVLITVFCFAMCRSASGNTEWIGIRPRFSVRMWSAAAVLWVPLATSGREQVTHVRSLSDDTITRLTSATRDCANIWYQVSKGDCSIHCACFDSFFETGPMAFSFYWFWAPARLWPGSRHTHASTHQIISMSTKKFSSA